MKTKTILFASFFFILYFANTAYSQNYRSIETERVSKTLLDSVYEYYEEYGDNAYTRYYYQYNEFGKKINQTRHTYYIDSWYVEMTEYQYNYEGNLSESVTSYIEYQSVWRPYSKIVNSYNENGHLSESVEYLNTAEQGVLWTFDKKIDYTYNFYGKRTGKKLMLWNPEQNEWDESVFEQFFYNDENEMYLYRYNIWDENSNQYVFRYKTAYEFDESENVFASKQDVWDPETSDWLDFRRTTFSYSSGLLENAIVEVWNRDSLLWKNQWKYVYSYDSNALKISDSTFFWNDYTKTFGYRNRMSYHYSMHEVEEVSVRNLSPNKLLLFPNPTNGFIHINDNNLYLFTHINIYNQLGQLIDRQKITNCISLDFVSRGMYFIELIGYNERIIQKILVE